MLNKVYIIHYSKLKERRSKIEDIFSESDIEIEFIIENDKEEIQKFRDSFYENDYLRYFEKANVYDNFHSPRPPFRQLSDGEISCASKHMISLQKASENEGYTLILEDDVIPMQKKFLDKISTYMKEIPNDWDVVFLGLGCGQDFIDRTKKIKVTENIFKVSHPASNCAEAYIVNKKSSKLILDKIKPVQLPFDCEIAFAMGKTEMNVYWILPPLFYQGSVTGEYNSTLR